MEPIEQPINNTHKRLLTFIIILVIGIAAFFGFKKVTYSMSNEGTENSQLECNIYPIAPRVGGFVEQILVTDNQRVKQGDTLAILDYRDLKIRLQQAEIALASAEANLELVKNNVRAANSSAEAGEANIAATESNVEIAEVRVWKANIEFDRVSKLVALKSATQQQLDNVKAEKESAEKQLSLTKMQLNATKDQAGSSRSSANSVGKQVKLAEITIEQRRSDLEFAQLNLSYTVITSPCDGYVSKKNLQVGQLVNAGTSLFAIVDNSKLWITANFKETQLSKIKPGQTVEIKVDAYPGKIFEGTVESIQAATGSKFALLPADNSTGNFVKVVQRVPVRIALKDEKSNEFQLRAGMNAEVDVRISL